MREPYQMNLTEYMDWYCQYGDHDTNIATATVIAQGNWGRSVEQAMAKGAEVRPEIREDYQRWLKR